MQIPVQVGYSAGGLDRLTDQVGQAAVEVDVRLWLDSDLDQAGAGAERFG